MRIVHFELPADDPAIFEMDLRGLRRHWAAQAGLPAISAQTMTGADRRAQALGYPELRLMEHAGTAVAAAVRALATDLGRWGSGPIVVMCGLLGAVSSTDTHCDRRPDGERTRLYHRGRGPSRADRRRRRRPISIPYPPDSETAFTTTWSRWSST